MKDIIIIPSAAILLLIIVYGAPMIEYFTTPKYQVTWVSTDFLVKDMVLFTDTVADTSDLSIPNTYHIIKRIK